MTTCTTAIVGGTGLVGRHILELLTTLPSVSQIISISRRPSPPSGKLTSVTSTETSTWPKSLSSLQPAPTIFISSLGTTARAAGSFASQRAIDFDLNLSLAHAALTSGTKIFVLISSGGSSATSRMPYLKMKGELDEAVQELGFEHVIILRPGLIVGDWKDRSFGQWFAGRGVAAALGTVNRAWKDSWAQDADVIAKAAVRAAMMARDGNVKEKVWILAQADVVRLGRSDEPF